MKTLLYHRIARILNRLAWLFQRFAAKLTTDRSILVTVGNERSLYRTSKGYYWLNDTGYIDKQLIKNGVFEGESTALAEKFVKPGDVVLDVGANIGYYSIIFSKLAGDSGKVIAFEPTKHYRDVLLKNIKANKCYNIAVEPFGLSDSEQYLRINLGPSSATLHSPLGFDKVIGQEDIRLTTMDSYVKNAHLDKIDFVKIDVDGHEPMVLSGSWSAFDLFDPIVLLEISHLHYLEAGVTAWDFYETLKSKGYHIYHEKNLKKMNTKEDFLRNCADFSRSVNILISKREIRKLANG